MAFVLWTLKHKFLNGCKAFNRNVETPKWTAKIYVLLARSAPQPKSRCRVRC